ncbi:MAG: GNAT family N-acetyltransferase [Parvularculaceae bacterium]|nr:GNAT family N-acetyltransferase [Parvularculaceae bacterium]
MTLLIRKAELKDAALIVQFVRDLAEYEKLADEAVASTGDIERALFCDNPKAYCLIAEWNGEPCGFALYFFNFSTFLGRHGVYLEDLFVRETHRGRGVGKALLAQLAKIAIDNNCGRLEWSVLDWNAPSIAFYKSLGADAMDEWTVYRLTGAPLRNLAGGA